MIALPAVSFLCFVLHLALAPVQWHSGSVAVSSLLVWLLICNLVQGVNSIIWAGNETIRIPVWCDIVTKVLLGALTVLPASCLCICLRLWRCTSGKEDRARPAFLSFEFFLCIMLPMVCMGLHTIVQDNRFDLAQDYGCEASIYPSDDAIAVVWLPSLLLSIATLPFAGLAVYVYIDRGVASSLSRDSPLRGTFKFIRPIINSILISSLMFASVVFTVYARVKSAGGIQPSLGWKSTHVHMSDVNVISPDAKLDVTRIAFSWWVIPVSSLVYISTTLLCFVCGSPREYLKRYLSLGVWFGERLHLPLSNTLRVSEKTEHVALKSPTSPMLVAFPEPKWDSTLRSASIPATTKVPLPPLTIPNDPPYSPANSDDSFVQSTLAYVGSPTGRQALGLPPFSSPVEEQEHAGQTVLLPPPALISNAFSMTPRTTPGNAFRHSDPFDPVDLVDSTPDSRHNSLLSAPWPLPPASVPSFHEPDPSIRVSPPSPSSLHGSHTRIPSVSSISTGSLASSTTSSIMYGEPYMAPAMPHDLPISPHDSPFQSFPPAPRSASALAVPKRVRRMKSKEALARNLSLASFRGRDNRDKDAIGNIVLTVVKESV